MTEQNPFKKFRKRWIKIADNTRESSTRWAVYALFEELNKILESQAKKAEKEIEEYGKFLEQSKSKREKDYNQEQQFRSLTKLDAFRLVQGGVAPTVMRNGLSTKGHVQKVQGERNVVGRRLEGSDTLATKPSDQPRPVQRRESQQKRSVHSPTKKQKEKKE